MMTRDTCQQTRFDTSYVIRQHAGQNELRQRMSSSDDMARTLDGAIGVLLAASMLRALVGGKADGKYWSALPAALDIVATSFPPEPLSKQDIIDVLVWGFSNSKTEAVRRYVDAFGAAIEADELDAIVARTTQTPKLP